MYNLISKYESQYKQHIVEGIKLFHQAFVDKLERDERKRIKQEQQLEEARKRIEEMNLQFQQQLNNKATEDPQGNDQPKKKKKKKKMNKADKKFMEKCNQDIETFHK